MKIDIQRLASGAGLPLPRYASAGAAGADLHAAIAQPVTLKPTERALIPTGFAMAIPEGWEGQVRPRSGLALKHGVTTLNAPGTIDCDYRGEVGVILINHGAEAFTVQRGDRVAQIVFAPAPRVDFSEVSELPDTARMGAGFGSTGGVS
jgi:dUTP pyrophosphatase